MIGGAFLISSCQPKVEKMADTNTEEISETSERIVLYQVMTRLFGNTNTTNKPWGTVEENGVGKFNDFTPKALKEIKDMGFTHIWYTGVIEHAVLTDYSAFNIALDDADVVKGRAGSPYAIKDYYDVNPDLAASVPDRMEEFEALVTRSHEAGLKVFIDFVPNHVARNYISDGKPDGVEDFGEDDDKAIRFDPNNNFYYIPGEPFVIPANNSVIGGEPVKSQDNIFKESPAKATGNDVFSATPSVNDWFETVKLNYGVDYLDNRKTYFDPVPDTWLKMKEILSFWAEKGVDGFRCDMAEMVPVEFWNWVTAEMKSTYPNLLFLAEIYNPDNYRNYIHTGGFDYLYDKVELYDTLKYIIQGHASTDGITSIWQRQEGIGDNMLRFLENHDEQRIASPDFAGDMKRGIPMMAATAFMHKGPVMMYFGQEVGEPGKGFSGFGGDDGRTTIFDYWGVPEHQKWLSNGSFDGKDLSPEQVNLRERYIAILKAVNANSALQSGAFFDLHYFNRNDDYQGYSDKVYTFLRHIEDQNLLIAINLGENSEEVSLKIPEAAWEKMDLTSNQISVEGDLEMQIDRASCLDYAEESTFKFVLPSYDYVILQLN